MVPSDTAGCSDEYASEVHARFPSGGAETPGAAVFALLAPGCVHDPVGVSGNAVLDEVRFDIQPESAADVVAAAVKNVLRFILRHIVLS
jgi:hypothetical protein